MHTMRPRPGWHRQLLTTTMLRAGLLRRHAAPPRVLAQGRTLFVCKGNIARSAYAAAKARQLGLQAVDCAGLRACPGKHADPRAVELAAARGIDLSTHRAKRIGELAPTEQDDVFTFELWQARALRAHYIGHPLLLGLWAERPCPHIEDPYSYDDLYYASCFDLIDQALARLAPQLRARHSGALPRAGVLLTEGAMSSQPMTQDPVHTDGDKYKVILENDRVRVLEYRDVPGDKTRQHHHPAFVLYVVSPFRRKLYLPDGKVVERAFDAGNVLFSDAQTHIGENVGNTPTHAILVEMKERGGAVKG